MTRKDLLAVGALVAAVLALTAGVWTRPGTVFFNHGDLYTYHWPLRHLTAASLIEGRLPFWNPYIMLGVPHAANSQAALFYPPALLCALFPLGGALAWDQLLHLLWAGFGSFLLARSGGLARPPALALSAAYALSPFLVWRVTAGIPTLLASLAWAPWAWLAWLGGGAALLSAVFALQFLSGHPQFLVINAAGMALWAAARPARRRLWTRLGAGALGALALAALQWPLTLELLRRSNRSGWPAEFASSYSLEPGFLRLWLFPAAFSSPVDAGWSGLASVYYESAGVWLGALMLGAAALGAVRSRAQRGPLLLLSAGLALALGAHGPLAFLLSLPGAGFLRTPARWSLLVLWGLWLLAGAGLGLLARRLGRFAALLPPLVFAELAAENARFLSAQDPAPLMAPNAAASRLGGRAARVLTDPVLANPNKSVLYRVRNVNGYEAFYPAAAARWAASAEGAPAADSSRVLVSRWRSDAASRAGVAVRFGPDGVEETAQAWPLAVFAGPDGRRLRPDPALEIERSERWRVSGAPPRGAMALALAEPRWPGWRARLNGRPAPLLPWGAAFQAVPLEPQSGPVELRFEFQPTGWPWWALLSAAAWAFWLGSMMRRAEPA